MTKALELTGRVFGKLSVIRRHPENSAHRRSRWVCKCACGEEVIVLGRCLTSGDTKSCGCLHKEVIIKKMTTHGAASRSNKSREYRAWLSMKGRCYQVKNIGHARYGGAGITVCPEWINSFETFLTDMGECPKSYELDRIDNERGYSPDNCRWASQATQTRNRRYTKLSMEKADAIRKDPHPAKVLAKEYGVSTNTVYDIRSNRIWRLDK